MERCLAITTDKNESLIKDLKQRGYSERSGSAGYNRNQMVIIPKKKWFWLTSNTTNGTEERFL